MKGGAAATAPLADRSWLTDLDLHLFNEGTHTRLYERLGAHIVAGGDGVPAPDGAGGRTGARAEVRAKAVAPDSGPATRFAVWAPNAAAVSVLGDWNGWRDGEHRLHPVGSSGIWTGVVPEVGKGARYK
ncbi:MAG TPA: hypothetical protein VFH47_03510, partial [Candidatus Thermoplasmatota archaeon]|nr:hypothetical protein [Candidatus Thermoplasmatota archaeon]